MGHLFRLCDHRLAILVHQGSDPTLPYQTLGDPKERHSFPETLADVRQAAHRFLAMGTLDVFSLARPRRLRGIAPPDAADCTVRSGTVPGIFSGEDVNTGP